MNFNKTTQELLGQAERLSEKAEELLTLSTENFNRQEHIDIAVAMLDTYKQAMMLVSSLAEALEGQGYEIETTYKDGADTLLIASKMHLRIAKALHSIPTSVR